MAQVRPRFNLTNVTIATFVSGAAIADKAPVILSGSDFTVVTATTNTQPIGYAMTSTTGSGEELQVALVGPRIPALAGATGVTRNKLVKVLNGAMVDVPANGGGTTAHQIAGLALESATDGKIFAMIPLAGSQVSAT